MVQLPRTRKAGPAKKALTRRRSRPDFGYSLLRAKRTAKYFNALLDEMLAFRVPIEGTAHGNRAGRLRAAIQFSAGAGSSRPRLLFKTGAKEIAPASASCRASWPNGARNIRAAAGTCTSRSRTVSKNVFYDARGRNSMSKVSRVISPAACGCARVCADVLAHREQLQAARRRVLGARQTHLGHRQPHGELSRDRRLAEEHPARNALSGRTSIRSSQSPRWLPPVCTGSKKACSSHRADHWNQCRAEKIARAPRSLAATTEIFKRSATARDWFGDDFVEHFSATREWEWRSAGRRDRLETQALLRNHLRSAHA